MKTTEVQGVTSQKSQISAASGEEVDGMFVSIAQELELRNRDVLLWLKRVMVSKQLEYFAQFWLIYWRKNILVLETVQKRLIHLISGHPITNWYRNYIYISWSLEKIWGDFIEQFKGRDSSDVEMEKSQTRT